MESVDTSLTTRVEELYRSSSVDPSLERLLGLIDAANDDDLAELVEVDGRMRIALKRPVDLGRYLGSIPDLTERELALDAAIDVALRALSGGARPTKQAVEALTAAYPALAGAIGDAAILGRAVVSTTGVSQLVQSTPHRAVPCEFGPVGRDGISRYQLTEVLGTGSSGEVYLAVDRLLSESDRPAKVAIKVIAAPRTTTRARLQLAEEASKARRVLHDHVVRVLDRGLSDEGEDYIVYEHVEGGDLDRWLKEHGPLTSPQVAATMVAKMARGLQAAHMAGLVHCDLKPSNILVTRGGDPKVADFGIAVRERDLAERESEAMRPIGNVAFISPEQYRGEPGSLGVQSDVYALGGILYYMITGDLPNGSTVAEVARVHDVQRGRVEPPDPSKLRPNLDKDLVAVCRRAMSVVPAGRHSSAAALAEDLEAWVRREPIAWMKPSLWKITKLGAKRRPGLAMAVGVAIASLLAGAGGIGYWVSVAQANRVRADASDQKINSSLGELETFMRFLAFLQKNGMGKDLIQMTVALEGITGTVALGTPEHRMALWQLRIDRVRTIIAEYEATGRGLHVETLLWQAMLGYWLVNDGKFDEAVAVLTSASGKWDEKGLGDDSMAKQTQRMLVSARVFQARAAADSGTLKELERSGLPALAKEVAAASRAPGLAGGLPTREKLLEAEVAIYGPSLLNQPAELAAAQARLDRFREADQTPGPAKIPSSFRKGKDASPKR